VPAAVLHGKESAMFGLGTQELMVILVIADKDDTPEPKKP
jgi:hypothetical protein